MALGYRGIAVPGALEGWQPAYRPATLVGYVTLSVPFTHGVVRSFVGAVARVASAGWPVVGRLGVAAIGALSAGSIAVNVIAVRVAALYLGRRRSAGAGNE